MEIRILSVTKTIDGAIMMISVIEGETVYGEQEVIFGDNPTDAEIKTALITTAKKIKKHYDDGRALITKFDKLQVV